ncbi:hypothetical protein G3A50_16175 [Ancylobacter pratisalsi]|uniref:Uncharacterized protein n=2 Tax=Ancylobacter pratisalsi TaxID=1745854 RepID=A0A6P1YS46_9HYPH|nr:hypothetical protein G3A50_16175 [Ancylobacter pratisalsi]
MRSDMTPSRSRQRIRAQRTHEPATAIAMRSDALRPFLGNTVEERRSRLRNMLRAERGAARRGVGYDPLRHAAISRLMREITGGK